jgi:hypothetical protein
VLTPQQSALCVRRAGFPPVVLRHSQPELIEKILFSYLVFTRVHVFGVLMS